MKLTKQKPTLLVMPGPVAPVRRQPIRQTDAALLTLLRLAKKQAELAESQVEILSLLIASRKKAGRHVWSGRDAGSTEL